MGINDDLEEKVKSLEFMVSECEKNHVPIKWYHDHIQIQSESIRLAIAEGMKYKYSDEVSAVLKTLKIAQKEHQKIIVLDKLLKIYQQMIALFPQSNANILGIKEVYDTIRKELLNQNDGL